ncbi:hypothetical protein CKAH01_01333 [Colletotrichum kahawae]|uniref:Uncharacterized protein n=1 Tax=Colletotrichum kahawae TaxID=34407 RepID=A0AAE0D4Y1_COLKA|nr:hypothetical protein CKAH01_01333 [Colletotrichum kahawae]
MLCCKPSRVLQQQSLSISLELPSHPSSTTPSTHPLPPFHQRSRHLPLSTPTDDRQEPRLPSPTQEHQQNRANLPRGPKSSPTQLTFPAPLLANRKKRMRLPKPQSRKLGKYTPLYKATSDQTTLPTPLHLSKTLARRTCIPEPYPNPPSHGKKKEKLSSCLLTASIVMYKVQVQPICHVSRLRLRCLTSRQTSDGHEITIHTLR